MAETKSTSASNQAKGPKANSQPKRQQRVITNPKDVAQLVLMQIDNVNAKKDDLTIAVKGLADTAKQLVRVYAQQQNQITKLAKRIEELEKGQSK
jgi:hypothetical protein